MSTPSPTGDREFRNEVVRISELTVNTATLEGLTFRNCKILGPAVLVPQGTTMFAHSSFDAPDANALFWEVPPTRTLIVGAIAVLNCTFSACRFQDIGIAGPAEQRVMLEQGFSG